MFKYLTIAAIFAITVPIAPANAEEPAARQMDTNNDGMVSYKEARDFNRMNAAENRESSININSLRTQNEKKAKSSKGSYEREVYIAPLESRDSFTWSE